MPPYPVRIAIDLETTGLHPEQDAVIEIGAIKFAGEAEVETFEALVAPPISVPYRVQRLTGITPAQLKSAPPLAEVLPRLRAFLGDLPLVGHSVPFDAAFLRRVGLARRNPLIDTYELASALLPDLPSYTLAAVGAALGVRSPTYHRALADAQLSREVFLALLARLEALDATTLEGLDRLPAPSDWTPGYLIRGTLRSQRNDAPAASPFAGLLATSLGDRLAAQLGMDPAVLSFAVSPETPPLITISAPAADTEPAADASVGAGSIAPSVRELLATGGVLLAETHNRDEGLVACLAPAVAWAREHGERVLVCCADLSSALLLIRRVLPQVYAAAHVVPDEQPLALVAEQEAYLCLHRWFGAARMSLDGELPRDLARGLAKLTVWAGRTASGLRAEVTLSGQETLAWERARFGTEYMEASANCAYRRDGYCFAARARDAGGRASLVVTTHAALAAQLAGRQTLLPSASRVVILDGHLLEDALRIGAGAEVDRQALLATLAQLGEMHGKARAGLLHLAAARLDAKQAQMREPMWFAAVERARQSVAALFTALRSLLSEAQGEAPNGALGDAPEQRALRLSPRTQQLHAWGDLTRSWSLLDARLDAVARHAREAAQLVLAARDTGAPLAAGGVASDLVALANTLDEQRRQGAHMLMSGEHDNEVSWLRVPYPQTGLSGQAMTAPHHQQSGHARPTTKAHKSGTRAMMLDRDLVAEPATQPTPDSPVLHTAPVRVGPFLAPLWSPGHALVLTAPALAVAGDFAYSRGSLGLPDTTRTLAPAIDCADQTLICLPTDVPEPNTPQYQRRLDDALIALATALSGGVVAIFPSHAALRASAASIRRALERHDILVLAQGQDGSARQLWQSFRSEPRVVLLGAGAFWEGAEQPDHPPACIVVTRVPFPALSDPLLAARAETWSDPQNQFVVPHAALRLRQALGGLAWSHRERNAILLFDRRLQTRAYGQTILGTLPRCTQQQDTMSQLVERVTDWLAPPASVTG